MNAFLLTGHLSSCASRDNCLCLIRVCVFAGILTLSAAVLTGVVGYTSSLAVLSDAPHALSDCIGYFIAAIVMSRHGTTKLDERKQKMLGRLLAVLLGASVLLIVHEAYDRFQEGTHVVRPTFAMVSAGFAVLMNGLSWWMFTREERGDRLAVGLIGHAKSDTFHALAVFVMAALATLFGSVLPLKQIDFVMTGIILIYVSAVAVLMWFGIHFHLPVRKTFNRLLGRKSEHDHSHCDGHHH